MDTQPNSGINLAKTEPSQTDSIRDSRFVVDELADKLPILDEEFLWLTELLLEVLSPPSDDKG
jgi:hypothetical protein